MPVCTDEWHHKFVLEAPQGLRSVFLVGPVNSYLKEKSNLLLILLLSLPLAFKLDIIIMILDPIQNSNGVIKESQELR